jgi:hypothetical protein
MKQIILGESGKFALVDDADFATLTAWDWRYFRRNLPNSVSEYAVRNETRAGRSQCVYMHRQILCAAPGLEIDHWDGDGLNNQRGNLRPATHSQNMGNQRKSRGSSAYKGVYFHKATASWHAMIQKDRQRISCGYFKQEDAAARAYDSKARDLWGAFASLNFPQANERSAVQ